MAVVRIRPAAEQDLIEIYRYIAADAPARARAYVDKLYKVLDTLAVSPLIGAARLPRYPDFRGFTVGSHVLLYRPLPNRQGIDVIRVFHGARDWHRLAEHDVGEL